VLKYLFLAAAISVSISLVVQHAHYSFDILAAPVFAYISYKLVAKFSKHYYKEVAL
jgi:membrane-associated phospholipid phosphatase